MSNPFNVLRPWKTGETRDVTEKILTQARLDGRFDSYSRAYVLDGARWKVQSQISRPTGETIYTLVCTEE